MYIFAKITSANLHVCTYTNNTIFFCFSHSIAWALCCLSVSDYCCIVSIAWIQHISPNHSLANGYPVVPRNIENIFLIGNALLLTKFLFGWNLVYQLSSYKVCAIGDMFSIPLKCKYFSTALFLFIFSESSFIYCAKSRPRLIVFLYRNVFFPAPSAKQSGISPYVAPLSYIKYSSIHGIASQHFIFALIWGLSFQEIDLFYFYNVLTWHFVLRQSFFLWFFLPKLNSYFLHFIILYKY